MKYVLTSGVGYYVKPNYKEHLDDGLVVTEKSSEALKFDTKEEAEHLFETLQFKFRSKPLVIAELEIGII